MKRLIVILGSLGLIFLSACQKSGDDRGYYGDLESCVDFGGGCNYEVFYQFRSNSVRTYPVVDGLLKGAAQQNYNGRVSYSSLDHCGTEQFSFGGYAVRLWLPAILPLNGGLACISSELLYYNSGFLWTEFNMYNYNYMNPEAAQVKTHYISLTNTNSSGGGVNSFEQYKLNQQSVSLPQLCDTSVDAGRVNHRDCGTGATCEPFSNLYTGAGRLGICINP